MRALRLLSIAGVVMLAGAAPASGKGRDIEVIASGLDNPLHLTVATDGDVYVAEAGRGGGSAVSRSCFDSVEGSVCTGATGAVTRISRDSRTSQRRWHQERVATGLASFAPAGGNHAIGPSAVAVDGGRVLILNGGPTGPTRGEPDQIVPRDPTLVAEEPVSALYGRVLELGPRGRLRPLADIWRFERDFNPDAEVGNPLVESNPNDLLVDSGRLVVADAGGNSIVRGFPFGRLEALTVFPNVDTPDEDEPNETIAMQAVPTGVAKGPDGAYYVSEFTGYPFPVGGAKVFRVDPRTGTTTTYASGFTNSADLDFARDGTLYVLDVDADSVLEPGLDGAIWKVPPRGAPRQLALPAGTLTEPSGLAVGRDGNLYVTNHSREAGNGQVLVIDPRGF